MTGPARPPSAARQGALALPAATALGRADFLVAPCNRAAFRALDCWPDGRWPDRRAPALVLHGPARSGRSHLARLWCEKSGAGLIAGDRLAGEPPDRLARHGAVAVDDAEGAPEPLLLHLYNCCVEAGASLLVVARQAPAAWPIALPDLASRLRAAPCAAIAPPDDALLAALLVKHFADRQLRVAPAVVDFLVRRMERSFAAALTLVERLDREALAARRPITVGLARDVLAAESGQPSLSSDYGSSDFGVT